MDHRRVASLERRWCEHRRAYLCGMTPAPARPSERYGNAGVAVGVIMVGLGLVLFGLSLCAFPRV
jgi:hypothetical protein